MEAPAVEACHDDKDGARREVMAAMGAPVVEAWSSGGCGVEGGEVLDWGGAYCGMRSVGIARRWCGGGACAVFFCSERVEVRLYIGSRVYVGFTITTMSFLSSRE
jgi:hypothetical protein